MKHSFFFIVLFSLTALRADAQIRFANTDSVQAQLRSDNSVNRAFACLALVDHYIDKRRPDSSLYWLYKVYEVHKVKTNTLIHYFVTSRQAEIYYYDGLDQLGINETRKALSIAQILNDSILLTDAYNFLGLFDLIQDSTRQSIYHFRKSLTYIKQPPYPPQYISLTQPLHVYGNIAEAYNTMGNVDSGRYYNTLLYNNAKSYGRKRATLLAILNDASYYNKLKKFDSAIATFNQATTLARQYDIVDLQLLTYSGKAETKALLGDFAQSKQLLQSGAVFAQQHNDIGALHRRSFYSTAYHIYAQCHDVPMQLKAFEKMWTIDTAKDKRNRIQVQRVMSALRSTESEVLKLRVTEAEQKNKSLIYTLTILALAATALGTVYLYNKARLKQQVKLDVVKTKISTDLHDDLGATLGSIKLYSELAQTQNDTEKVNLILGKMALLSKDAMEQISDIAWAIKPAVHQASTLESRIKDYSTDLLGTQQIEVLYDIDDSISLLMKGIESKKHLLLIIKECINNISKYSKATCVNISLQKTNTHIAFSISDNGIGFDNTTLSYGNGLHNIQSRTQLLRGQCSIAGTPNKGVAIQVTIPIASFSADA